MTDQEEKLEKGKLEPPRLPARDTFQSTPNIFEKINKRENIYHNIYGDTNRRWTGILTLLCRWKQSVYSLIWNDVVIFLVISHTVAGVIITQTLHSVGHGFPERSAIIKTITFIF